VIWKVIFGVSDKLPSFFENGAISVIPENLIDTAIAMISRTKIERMQSDDGVSLEYRMTGVSIAHKPLRP